MLLDELVSQIGSEYTENTSSSSRQFAWVYEESSKPPRDCDDLLATVISRGEVRVTSAVVDTLLRLKLAISSRCALVAASICALDALRILVQNPQYLSEFLLADNYSTSALRNTVASNTLPEDAILVLFDQCIAFMEESLPNLENSVDEANRYTRFLSLLVDGMFMKWFLSMSTSEGAGKRIARSAAILNRHRRTLVQRQHQRVKSGESCVGKLLNDHITPQYNGEVFHHTLSI